MSVYLIHARTEPHVWIKLEVIAVIARLDTLEATVKRVNFKLCISLLFHRVSAKYTLVCTLPTHRTKDKKFNCQRYVFLFSNFRHKRLCT